jgi:hypothetical protein
MSEPEHKHVVKIFIHPEADHLPNPTTGAALCALDRVEAGSLAIPRSYRQPRGSRSAERSKARIDVRRATNWWSTAQYFACADSAETGLVPVMDY